jgi:hypothetical protein
MHEQLLKKIMTLESIVQQLNVRISALEQFIISAHTTSQ